MNIALILAGGSGKRMKTDKPKVLHEVLGKPMLEWVIDACLKAAIIICPAETLKMPVSSMFVCVKVKSGFAPF